MQPILKVCSILLLFTVLINAQPAYKEQILTANGGNVVSMDKEWAVVGDPVNNRVHVYRLNYSQMHSATMNMWEKLPSTLVETGTGANIPVSFGSSVAISGGYIIVGDPGFKSARGRITLFGYNSTTGNWDHLTNFETNTAGVRLGTSVAIATDGTNVRIAAGAPDFVVTGSSTGRVRTFLWNGSLTETTTLTYDSLHVRKFGQSLDIKGDKLIVGAPETVTPILSDGAVGAAYTYSYNGTAWVPFPTSYRIKPENINEHFGTHVAIDGNVSMISSTTNISSNSYIYQVNGTTWNETYSKGDQDGGDVDINDGIYLMAQRSARLSFFSEIDGDTTVSRPLNILRSVGSNAYTSVSLYKEQVMVNAPDSSQAVAIDVPCGIKTISLVAFEWKMVTMSCGDGSATFRDIFEDDGLGTYGPNANWVMYEQNGTDWSGNFNSMKEVDIDTPMELGKGYWIITDANVTWKVDEAAVTTRTQLDVSTITPPATIGGYYKISLPDTVDGEIKKIMLGNPFPRSFKLSDVQFYNTGMGAYSIDDIASPYNPTVYVYDTSQLGQPYRAITSNGTPGFNDEIAPYQGFWIKEESTSLVPLIVNQFAAPFEK